MEYQEVKNKKVQWIPIVMVAFLAGVAGAISAIILFPKPQQSLQVVERSGAEVVYALAHDSVVEIEVSNGSESYFFEGAFVESEGSGVIISSDGYVVTNHHVVEGSKQVLVRLGNGKEYEAMVIGSDAVSDLALLKIEEKNLIPVTFGNSDNVVIGEAVFAIGNPLGEFGGSITDGIISAEKRRIIVENQVIEVFQTNAAVNPGNSGGGLFNVVGELIGIVNAKSMGDDIEGIGFAIPSNFVKEIIEDLKENGYVSNRATLGIYVSLNQSEQDSKGALIQDVIDGGAAEIAGLQSGDIIVKVDSYDIDDYYGLRSTLMEYSVGNEIELTVLRDGEKMVVKCILQSAQPANRK